MFIVHSFEYTATFLDMLSNTVWTKKTHTHTHTHILLTSKLCLQNLANNGCTKSSPRSMQRTSRNEESTSLGILHISHPLKTYQHIPSYSNYVNHPASLVTDKTPPFLSRGSCGSAGIWSWSSTAASSTAWSWGKILEAGVAAEFQEA